MEGRTLPKSRPRRLTAIALLAASVSAPGLACKAPSLFFGSTRPPDRAVFRVGLGADPETLDPALTGGAPETQILINLFEGLVEYDPATSEPRPGVAEKWESNAEATEFTFTLRPNARWNNGDPVTARDFVYSWRRALDPRLGSDSASMLFVIKNAEAYRAGRMPPEDLGIIALDDHNLRIRLAGPTSYFPRMLVHSVFRPVHRATLEKWSNAWTEPAHIVSNGPFQLSDWRPGDRVVLQRNPRYWNAAQVAIDQAVYYLSDDFYALLSLYKAGEIDAFVSGLLPLSYIPFLKNLQDYRTGEYLGIYFYGVNVRQAALRDPRVRRALSLAIDRRLICERLLRAGQSPAFSFVPSDFDGGYRPLNRLHFDPDLGKRLMAEAGYPGGRQLGLSLHFNTNETHRQIAEAIQSQWQAAFPLMRVELVNQEWQVFMDGLRRGSYDVARRFWTADYDDPTAFLEIMRPASGSNFTGWGSAEYDRLFLEACATTDGARRMQLLVSAEAILLSELPVIPIYSAVTYFLVKPYVEGWMSNKLDRHPLKYVKLIRKQ